MRVKDIIRVANVDVIDLQKDNDMYWSKRVVAPYATDKLTLPLKWKKVIAIKADCEGMITVFI